jgi:hypothetical protein
MPSQPFHKPTHISLRRPHQQSIPPLNMFRKLLQIPLISLTASRPQPLLHPQVRYKLPHDPHIPQSLASILHSPIIRAYPHENSPTTKPVPT